MGARSEAFSKKTGWNFDSPRDRRRFLRRLREEQPDEVLISPTCRLWSPMQELSLATNPSRRPRLLADRKWDHNNHLIYETPRGEALPHRASMELEGMADSCTSSPTRTSNLRGSVPIWIENAGSGQCGGLCEKAHMLPDHQEEPKSQAPMYLSGRP